MSYYDPNSEYTVKNIIWWVIIFALMMFAVSMFADGCNEVARRVFGS